MSLIAPRCGPRGRPPTDARAVPLLLDDETGVPCALRVAGVQVGLDSVIKSLSCDPRHLSSHGVDGASGTVTRTTTVVQGPCDRRGRVRLDGSRPEGGHCAGGGGLSRNPATLPNAGPGPEPQERVPFQKLLWERGG